MYIRDVKRRNEWWQMFALRPPYLSVDHMLSAAKKAAMVAMRELQTLVAPQERSGNTASSLPLSSSQGRAAQPGGGGTCPNSRDGQTGSAGSHLRPPSSGGPTLYCVCRRPDDQKGGFMVGCDRCDEWFHGECVGVLKSEVRRQAEYVCPRCCLKEGLPYAFRPSVVHVSAVPVNAVKRYLAMVSHLLGNGTTGVVRVPEVEQLRQIVWLIETVSNNKTQTVN